jgi:hypothetical protein
MIDWVVFFKQRLESIGLRLNLEKCKFYARDPAAAAIKLAPLFQQLGHPLKILPLDDLTALSVPLGCPATNATKLREKVAAVVLRKVERIGKLSDPHVGLPPQYGHADSPHILPAPSRAFNPSLEGLHGF